MSKPKTYFWLKLLDTFYQRREIRKLRMYKPYERNIVLYHEMLLYAMNYDGFIRFTPDEDFISELAVTIDEKAEDIITTLDLLKKFKLAEIVDKNTIFLRDAVELVGKETTKKEQNRRAYLKRKERLENEKNSCKELGGVGTEFSTHKLNSVEIFSTEIEIEKEIDKKEVEKKKENFSAEAAEILTPCEVLNPIEELEKILGITCSSFQAEKYIALCNEVGEENFKKALEKAAKANAKNYNYVSAVAMGLKNGIDFDTKPKAKNQEKSTEEILAELKEFSKSLPQAEMDW